ncbi:MAG: FtsX-like permease family protein [Bacteroidales bacterium]|jgi:putative ABC transport system permease protein|nr:FtsX-like permease family protein [Bacteroidales bacterium]
MKVLRKTGVSTLINILGMSVAFAAAMILMVQVRWDTTYDANFEGHEQVFRMENNWMDQGLFSTHICRPFIERSRDASPNIEAICTWQPLGEDVLYKEGDRESPITIPMARVDSSFFSVFPVEWVEGSAREFDAARTCALNEAFAKMIFGEESAVGKILENGSGESRRVIGVFKNTPRNFSAHVGMLSTLGDTDRENSSEWSYNAYLKLKNPSMAEETEDAIYTTLGEYISSDEESRAEYRSGFRISQIHEAHFERDVRANVPSANKAITITLAAIAILLILIAIINFINFAFAEIPFRIKNINTRKVLGESRGSLIGRQLMHAGLIALVAFAIAALIMHVIAGTSWASYVSDSIALKDNVGILILMLGIALFSAVVAGIAPALYSTAQPAALVLKGSYAMSVKGKMLRNVLVSLQFVLSFIFILMALYVHVQTKFMMSKDMGFPQENILQVWCGYSAGAAHESLKDKLLQNPSITDVTFSDNLIVSDQKMGWGRTGDDGKQIFMEVLPVTDDFVRFFNLQIIDGRDFRESDNQSETGVFIANETFINMFPQYHVGSQVGGHVDNTEIVGIVKDFNFKSLQHAMGPLVLLIWGKTQWRNFGVMYVKTAPESDFKEISSYIKEAVCAFDPTREPDQVRVRHLDEWIENMYQSEQSLGKLITIASFVALLIAIIGIIGLVFFETQFIRKEIAVRRVNGATVGSILQMINKKYLIMAGASFVIAAPIAYYLMTAWRKGFAYQAPVPVWIFIVALLAVAAITLAVVTLQSWRAASANPVESLKNE